MIRLVSKYSVEERIIEIATKKLLLEEIILNKLSKDEIQDILKSGSIELFK